MEDKEFIFETYYNDLLKVAKVNLFTGEYKFWKINLAEMELGCLEQVATIDGYIKSLVDCGLIYPQDVSDYLYYTDLSYLRKRAAEQKRKLTHSFRRKIGAVYVWVTFEILIPKDFSKERPWVVFEWKEADNEHHVMEDAIRMLSTNFHKILRVNLTEDSHEEIKLYDDEMVHRGGIPQKISEWWKKFAFDGFVHEEDLEEYLRFTDLERVRRQFWDGKDCIKYRYRRKTDDMWRWVSMEMLRSIDYTDENQIVMLYVRDIHDEYMEELNYRKELEYYCNNDVLTGIWNRYYYENYCSGYDKRAVKGSLGVMFADVNGLKYINDNLGHKKGDEHIQQFARMLTDSFEPNPCCRISGDEFIVFFDNMEKAEVSERVSRFHDQLQRQQYPLASIGYAWTECAQSIGELVKKAETEMYTDKELYHLKYPERCRAEALR